MQKNFCDQCEKDITGEGEWVQFSSFKMINGTKEPGEGRELIRHKVLILCVECGEPKQEALYKDLKSSTEE